MQACEIEMFQKFFEKDSSEYHAIVLEYQSFAKKSQSRRCNQLSWMFNSDSFRAMLNMALEEVGAVFLEDGDKFPASLLRMFVTEVQKRGEFNRGVLLEFLMEQSFLEGLLLKKLDRTHMFFRRERASAEELTVLYMKDLKGSILRSPPTCKAEIEQFVKQVVRASAVALLKEDGEQDMFIETYTRETGEEPASHVLGDFTEFMQNKKRLFEVYIDYKRMSYDFKFDEVVTAFRSMFGREITVYELRSIQRRVLEGESLEALLLRYRKSYTEMFEVFEETFQEFLKRAPDLFEFVRDFVEQVLRKDSADRHLELFKQDVIDMILRTEEYSQVLTTFVKHFCESVRNTTAVSSKDTRYFTHRLREARLSVRDQCCAESMHQIFSEWTTQQQEIQELFKKIMERDCEEEEMSHFIEYYRWDNAKGVRTNIVIMEELYASLEYQDVVKSNICNVVPNIPRASLYSLMRKGIEEDLIKTLRSEEEILNFVNEHL